MKSILTAPPEAMGALYFLPGQYLFQRFEGGNQSVKALSSGQISRAFREHHLDTGWFSQNVLRYREAPEGNSILSFEPAGRRTIFLETDTGEIVEITIPLPTLILFGRAQEFYLWAAKGKRVGPKTKLAVAPLPNIGGNTSGKICFGGNEVPEAKAETLSEVWNLIFNAPFNRDHSSEKCVSQPKDVRRLLFDLAAKKLKRFPNAELLETNTSLEDFWNYTVENKPRFRF